MTTTSTDPKLFGLPDPGPGVRVVALAKPGEPIPPGTVRLTRAEYQAATSTVGVKEFIRLYKTEESRK